MKKQLFSLCMLALVLSDHSFAADNTPSSGSQGRQSPVRQYVKEHVTPVILQKRQVLEKELSDAEKAEIIQSRASLAELRQQHHVFMQAKPEDMPMHTYLEQNGSDKRADIRQQERAIMERLDVIARNHSNTLDDIKSDIEPQTKQWKEDIARLQPQNKNGGQWQHHHFDGPMMHGLNGRFAQEHFLLMSATASANNTADELKSDMLGTDAATTATESVSAFQIGPNPASNEIITANTDLPAQNELVIYDIQGRSVLTAANVQGSQHLDISQLASGSYVVQLRSGDQSESRQVVVKR